MLLGHAERRAPDHGVGCAVDGDLAGEQVDLADNPPGAVLGDRQADELGHVIVAAEQARRLGLLDQPGVRPLVCDLGVQLVDGGVDDVQALAHGNSCSRGEYRVRMVPLLISPKPLRSQRTG